MRWMRRFSFHRKHGNLATAIFLVGIGFCFPQLGRAAEHITLKNGFDLICDHRQAEGNRMRLYMDSGDSNFMDVNAVDIASVEYVDLPRPVAASKPPVADATTKLTPEEMRELLTRAGSKHDLDADL